MASIMENQDNEDDNFNKVVETLVDTFGKVLNKDALISIAEGCGGDLYMAVEAAMNIANDTNVINPENNSTNEINSLQAVENVENRAESNTCSTPQEKVTTIQPPPGLSYAGVSQKTDVVPRRQQNPPQDIPKSTIWTDQLRQIMTYHNNGSRVLILMRGVPGSGKTYLARQLVEMMIGSTTADYRTHICSTDDYFINNGLYQYDMYKLSDAHSWNQRRVRGALQQGQSPLIIDNTNIKLFEMEPYLKEGVKNGYIIEVVEPNTPWARNALQLLKRNKHNVPMTTIKRMLENYQSNITGAYLLHAYGLSYPANFVPPVLRTIPAFRNEQNNVHIHKLQSQSAISNNKAISIVPVQPTSFSINESNILEINNPNQPIITHNNVSTLHMNQNQGYLSEEGAIPSMNENNSPNEYTAESEMNKRHLEIQKQLEEMEKVDQEWENGETWDKQSQETIDGSVKNITTLVPKPPRRIVETTPDETMLDTVNRCEDWRQISMFMPPWNESTSLPSTNALEVPKETRSSSTFMERGDTDLQIASNTMKVISATPRDINLFNVSFQREKIPDKRMLDKSTVTNELLIVDAYRCKREKHHFAALRKMFKNIPKTVLRDIFDKCCGDVNWVVEIVIEANNKLGTVDTEDSSDTEEETEDNQEECNCLAAYNIVPNKQLTSVNQEITTETLGASVVFQKKPKSAPSENSVQLKRQIEKNFVIADDYYSKHCLKIRKMRRGEYVSEDNLSLDKKMDEYINSSVDMPVDDAATEDNIQPNTSRGDAASYMNAHSSDEESNTSMDEVETTVNITMGKDFLAQLDEFYGRKNMTYPDHVVPNIRVPRSLLNEINAFWMESVMHQMDEHDKQNARMIQEDADFARQIAMKEEELARAGQEPEVPDFKEIMDMDLAMSLYQKNVAEWRHKEPDDIAAKMTRAKLYNLFPDMSEDTLAELLVAHDNNFRDTVEGLLISTGRSNILAETNGLNKFVMEKEMERNEKLLEEEKKALSEIEWPMLTKGEKVDMATVNRFRDEADMHMRNRDFVLRKAEEYIRRGIPQAALFYSDFASFHTRKWEHAKCMAATCLLHWQSQNSTDNATIDLHYLRVGEAKESLDLFLDTHIQKLKETAGRSGLRQQTLYLITGRGLHSTNGRPRVKPAIKKRLRERGLAFNECNPGLLSSKVCAEDKLTYQVPKI